MHVRADAAPLMAPPGFEGLVERLLPIERHLLQWLFDQRVEIAPDDFSWQNVPTSSLLRQFGTSESELELLVADLSQLDLLQRLAGAVGFTDHGLAFLRAAHDLRKP